MAETLRVEGLREYQLALSATDKEAKRKLRSSLRSAAEPVRDIAVSLADENIRNIGPAWDKMRIGVTNTSVYVAPKARRAAGSPRPNLSGLLMDKAMRPALERGEVAVAAVVATMLNSLGTAEGF